jgi:chromate transporter
VGLFALHLPFPLIIGLAGLAGALSARSHQGEAPPLPSNLLRNALLVFGVGGILWAAPVLWAWASGATFLAEVGRFFSIMAVVTFGGAYAVLAYMTQEVVANYGWLTTAQMMDALGLAETTPGPLILVTQFVGVVAGVEQGGLWRGFLAGLMVLWVTFVPCFIWIFAGAPVVDWLEGRPRLKGALALITAAVVGVIANLSLWFAAHVFFGTVDEVSFGPVHLIAPEFATLNLPAVALALVAAVLILRRHMALPAALAICAVLSLVWTMAGGLSV